MCQKRDKPCGEFVLPLGKKEKPKPVEVQDFPFSLPEERQLRAKLAELKSRDVKIEEILQALDAIPTSASQIPLDPHNLELAQFSATLSRLPRAEHSDHPDFPDDLFMSVDSDLGDLENLSFPEWFSLCS